MRRGEVRLTGDAARLVPVLFPAQHLQLTLADGSGRPLITFTLPDKEAYHDACRSRGVTAPGQDHDGAASASMGRLARRSSSKARSATDWLAAWVYRAVA